MKRPRFRRPRDRQELSILVGAVLILGLIWVFATLAGEVMEGDTRQFDEWVLGALRQEADPGQLKGPRWLRSGAEDLTALGSPTVLGLTVLAVTGYLFLHGLYRNGLFIFIASVGGWILNWLLKAAFARTRPDIVPHLREVMSSSFPSGHALTSAAVYLQARHLRYREDPFVCPGEAALWFLPPVHRAEAAPTRAGSARRARHGP